VKVCVPCEASPLWPAYGLPAVACILPAACSVCVMYLITCENHNDLRDASCANCAQIVLALIALTSSLL
jgi:hypothetical protein